MTIHIFGQLGLRLAWPVCAALFLTLATVGHASAATCRVTTAGTSAGSGSWASPINLQTALNSGTCTEVWVASGVYKPGSARTDTFNIQPGVAVYGGFAGTETDLGERDPSINVTILSGDIDNNDINTDGNNIAETSADIQGDNSYNIVTMNGTLGTPITASTVLDGFTITGGRANGSNWPQYVGGGLYCDGEGSGNECSPTLSSLSFSGNSAGEIGGAVFNYGGRGGGSSPTLSNVTFSGNSADSDGGAMYNWGGYGSSSPTLSNVTFSGNSAANQGGAMFNHGQAGISSPTLNNVTFSGNSATLGGAMYNMGYLAGTSSPILSNVILWGDTASVTGSEIINNAGSGTVNPTIDHSVVQGSGGSASWDTSLGSDGGGNLDADPKLGTLGIHGGSTATLLPGVGSSAIDTGNATTCSDPNTVNGLDQRGVTRPQGAACDIGAVEIEIDLTFADGFEAIP